MYREWFASDFCVTTLVVVWIEIDLDDSDDNFIKVTTLVVVWIEIFSTYFKIFPGCIVTTLVVVWIEIGHHGAYPGGLYVTTLVVVWIEIALSSSSVI